VLVQQLLLRIKEERTDRRLCRRRRDADQSVVDWSWCMRSAGAASTIDDRCVIGRAPAPQRTWPGPARPRVSTTRGVRVVVVRCGRLRDVGDTRPQDDCSRLL